MGHIELIDSVSSRRVRVADLHGVIRVDVTDDRPHLVVPKGAVIERLPSGESSDSEGRRM
jgi:hypothetical protein